MCGLVVLIVFLIPAAILVAPTERHFVYKLWVLTLVGIAVAAARQLRSAWANLENAKFALVRAQQLWKMQTKNEGEPIDGFAIEPDSLLQSAHLRSGGLQDFD